MEMTREEDQELWELLGEASTPAPASSFFSRNVVREVRGLGSPRESWLARWKNRRVLAVVAATFAAIVLTMASLHLSPSHRAYSAKVDNADLVEVSDDDGQDDDMNLLAGVDDDADDSQLL